MAQQIALLSEELLRASQEKVNIAQANCDTVFLFRRSPYNALSSNTLMTGRETHPPDRPSYQRTGSGVVL